MQAVELKSLQDFAKIGRDLGSKDLEHLDAPMGAYNYIRMANIISKHLEDTPLRRSMLKRLIHCCFANAKRYLLSKPFGLAWTINFLDWGAGYGQMTWLLRNRGLNTTGYNVEKREHIKDINGLANLPIIYGEDPVKLPFKDDSFEGVSSCGVLEHVPHPSESLKEIHRIIKHGGYLYIFMLPQKTSWVEMWSEFKGHSVHPVRYTVKTIRKMLAINGFRVEKLWKFNLIPKNLTGLPPHIKRHYGRFYKILYPLDYLLSKIPVLNLLSGVIEVIAQKKA